MAEDQRPFEDIRHIDGGFSIPALKWRELIFIGALRPEGELFVRDSRRPLPPFSNENLFPEGVRFRALHEGGRVSIRPVR